MIKRLLCNGEAYPLSVDRRAVITWQPSGRQKQFNISLKEGERVLFESGRVASALPVYSLPVNCRALTEYTYVLTVEYADGSEVAEGKFRTAYTQGFPCEAKWIGCGEVEPSAQPVQGNPATVLTKAFWVDQISATYLHCAGLGLFEAYINGKRVGDSVLDTAFTSYDKSVLYATHRIDGLLKKGENTITILLGDGWYNQTPPDEWNFYKAEWRGSCRAIVSVEGCVSLASNESWQCFESGVIASSALRLGEYHDFTHGCDYCKKPDNVRNAALMQPPTGKLKSQDCFSIKETELIDFISCEPTQDGYILDFGTEVTGYASVSFDFDGGEVKIKYGDRLLGGRIDNDSNGQYVFDGEYQTDGFTAPRGRVEFKPKFVYHCFRYIEVEGLNKTPQKGEIKAVFIRSGFERTGFFSCSDERINELYNAAIRSLECNFTGFPTDCPHREKNGWTGDMQLSAEVYLQNFNLSPNLYKWLEDIKEVQLADGMLPAIVPTSGWGYSWGNGPAWDYALFSIPKAMKNICGDRFVCAEFLPVMQKYFEFLQKRAVGNLVDWGLGDWNYPKNTEIKLAPVRLTSSCYYYAMAMQIGEILREMGDLFKAVEYFDKAREIRQAINAEYGETNDCITAIAARLYFGIAEEKDRPFLTEKLCSLLREINYTCGTGILGAKFVGNVLCESGRVDEFLKLLRCREYPSFGYWIEQGATALWEDFEGTNSRCHHMFADFAQLIERFVAGIDVRNEKSGVKVTVKPFMCDISHLSCTIAIPGGEVSLKYTREKDGVALEIDLPENAEAVLVCFDGEYPLHSGRNTVFAKSNK